MGRPKLWSETTLARLPRGSLAKIESMLDDGETQANFLRSAVERELRARAMRVINADIRAELAGDGLSRANALTDI